VTQYEILEIPAKLPIWTPLTIDDWFLLCVVV